MLSFLTPTNMLPMQEVFAAIESLNWGTSLGKMSPVLRDHRQVVMVAIKKSVLQPDYEPTSACVNITHS